MTKCQAVRYLTFLTHYSYVMFEDKLAQIGFSRSEARVYLELLRIGPQAVSIVAKRLGLNRTTCYSILRQLEKKALVSSFINGKLQCFVANDPNCLIGYIDSKCRSYDYFRNELINLVPQYRALMNEYTFSKPVVTYHEGLEGVKHVMYDALTAKGNCFTCLCLHKWFKSGLREFLLEYKDFRIATKQIPLSAIVPDTPEVRAFFDENYDKNNVLTKVKYLKDPKYCQLFENEMNIYDDKVAIIHLEKGQEFGVIIQSKEISNMQKSIFQLAWNGLEF